MARTVSRFQRFVTPLNGGILLTLVPTVIYATMDVAFEPGDRLLLYTDGITEAARVKGNEDEFFGDAELARVLTSTPASDDLMAAVLHGYQRWIGEGAPVSDDVSVVVIERLEQAVPSCDLINGCRDCWELTRRAA